MGLPIETSPPSILSVTPAFSLGSVSRLWCPPLWSSPLPTPSLQLCGAGALPVLKPSLAWPAHRHDTVISILVAGTLRSEAPLRDMAGPVAKVAGVGVRVGCETPAT